MPNNLHDLSRPLTFGNALALLLTSYPVSPLSQLPISTDNPHTSRNRFPGLSSRERANDIWIPQSSYDSLTISHPKYTSPYQHQTPLKAYFLRPSFISGVYSSSSSYAGYPEVPSGNANGQPGNANPSPLLVPASSYTADYTFHSSASASSNGGFETTSFMSAPIPIQIASSHQPNTQEMCPDPHINTTRLGPRYATSVQYTNHSTRHPFVKPYITHDFAASPVPILYPPIPMHRNTPYTSELIPHPDVHSASPGLSSMYRGDLY